MDGLDVTGQACGSETQGRHLRQGDELRSVALRLGHRELAVDSVEMAAPQGKLLPKRVSCLLC